MLSSTRKRQAEAMGMSVELVRSDAFTGAKAEHQSLAVRMMSSVIEFVLNAAHRAADEVVYAIREDIRHGRISRDPKDWEL
jgi:hypothetical protein